MNPDTPARRAAARSSTFTSSSAPAARAAAPLATPGARSPAVRTVSGLPEARPDAAATLPGDARTAPHSSAVGNTGFGVCLNESGFGWDGLAVVDPVQGTCFGAAL